MLWLPPVPNGAGRAGSERNESEMNEDSWGLPNDYLTGQNITRDCDRCSENVGKYGGCYAKRSDLHLCFKCFNEVFDPPIPTTLKKVAGWDA